MHKISLLRCFAVAAGMTPYGCSDGSSSLPRGVGHAGLLVRLEGSITQARINDFDPQPFEQVDGLAFLSQGRMLISARSRRTNTAWSSSM